MPTPDPRRPSAGGRRRPRTSRAPCRAERAAALQSRSSGQDLVAQSEPREGDFDTAQVMVGVEQAGELFGAEPFGHPPILGQVPVQVASPAQPLRAAVWIRSYASPRAMPRSTRASRTWPE